MSELRELGALLALLAAGVAALGALRSGRDLRGWLGRDAWRARRALRLALGCAGLAALCAALWLLGAAPRASGSGVEIVLALDVSRSMAVADTAPSRLRRALALAERVLDAPTAARFGLVVFAGDAFAALPLSEDREVMRAYLRAVDTELVSATGTDLGRALDAARGLFAGAADAAQPAARAVLLLSDGEHDPELPAAELRGALARLGERGARVVAVAFGTPQGAALPQAAQAPPDAEPEPRSRRRTELLAELARASGGALFRELEQRPGADALLAAASAAPAGPPPALPALLLCLALAALGAQSLLAADWSRSARRPLARESAARPAAARRGLAGRARGWAALAALALLGAAPPEGLRAGDRLLEAGDARAALAHFEALERREGASAPTRLRVGNALYRLGELPRAAAAYLDALRAPEALDAELRGAASFNLGTALLALGELEPARAALWAALRERPADRAAQWNYELALQRLAEQQAAQQPQPQPQPQPPEPQPQPQPQPGADVPQGEGAQQRPASGAALGELEAERWLAGVEDALRQPLREQLREALEQPRPGPARGQTW